MQGGEDAKGKECLGQTESGPSAAPSLKHGSERQGKPPRGSATRALRWRRVGSRFRPYHDLNSCDANGEPKQSRQSKQKPSGKVGILDGRTSDHDLEEECSWHTLGSMPPGGQFGRRWATCLAPGFCWLEPECPERPGCPGRPECKAASGQERLCKRIKPNQARTGLPCHPCRPAGGPTVWLPDVWKGKWMNPNGGGAFAFLVTYHLPATAGPSKALEEKRREEKRRGAENATRYVIPS